MTVEIITTGVTSPPRIIVFADHKVGKSTFAAGCPHPIFIQTEDGLDQLEVQAFPLCKDLAAVHEALDFLLTAAHDYKTVVIDSLDWTEKLIWADICKRNGWSQLGDGPYGAGYKLAKVEWEGIIAKLDALNKDKKMMLVLIAHAKIQKFEDPERQNYDRWDLDLHEKTGQLLCQYVDIIGFAALKIVTVEKKEGFGQAVVKAKETGERVLNLNKKAAYEAGNRWGLPDQVPLSWAALYEEIKKAHALRKAMRQNLADVAKEQRAARVEKANDKQTAKEKPNGKSSDSTEHVS